MIYESKTLYVNDCKIHIRETEETTDYCVERDDGCRFFFEIKSLWASRKFDETLAEIADLRRSEQIHLCRIHQGVQRDILFKMVFSA